MSGSTTTINDGPGDVWTVTAPNGVTVTPIDDPKSGLTTALNIAIDYSYADTIGAGAPAGLPPSPVVQLRFTGPVSDPTGMPLIPGGSYPGLITPLNVEVTNDTEEPISGYSFNLINDRVGLGTEPLDTSGVDAHPDDYAHFHSVTDTSLVNAADDTFNAAITLVDPQDNPAAFGPPEANQALPAPSAIVAAGTIQPGATEVLSGVDAGGVTLHSEDTPGPDGGNFVLDFFPQSFTTPPYPSVLLTAGNPDFQFPAADTDESIIFAGTVQNDDPTLNFITSGTVNGLVINGIVGVDSQANFGNINQQPGANVEVSGGIQISNGSLTDAIFAGTSLTVDGGTIDNGGTFAIDGAGTVNLHGAITVGSDGNNVLDLSQANVTGDAAIIQNGGVTKVGVNDGSDGSVTGVTFEINGGALQIDGPSGFGGVLGAPSGGTGIGQFGLINILDAGTVTQASVDTASGLLTFQNSQGNAIGSLQFHAADDLSGLRLSTSAGSPGVLTITDQPGTGFSPLPVSFT